MSSEKELFHAYGEWRRLALAETKAIQTRNWNLLSDCHLAIRDYQTLVSRLTGETRTEWRDTGCNLTEKEQNLRVMVSGLLDLTRQNQSLLQATIARTRIQLEQLGEAGRNLKRLRASYGYSRGA